MEEAEAGAPWHPIADQRMLLTGDALDGRPAVEWGLASECAPEAQLDDAAAALAARVAQLPPNQAQMQGVAFTRVAMEDVRGAVARRGAPFGDYGQEGR